MGKIRVAGRGSRSIREPASSMVSRRRSVQPIPRCDSSRILEPTLGNSMTITMREMLEAGVHFGHQTRFWNPKMAPYIYGHRNKIHIINLEKTQPLFEDAMKFIRQLASRRGTILMIGTKRQAREVIAQEAKRCRHALRRPALARRHADQLQDRQGLAQAPEGHEGADRGRHRDPDQEGSADVPARDGQAREGHRRHPGHERAARRDVRDRRRLPQDRRRRSARSSASRSSPWSTRTIRRSASTT